MNAWGLERAGRGPWGPGLIGSWALSGLGGLLLTAAFPRTDWAWIAWVALVPLLLAVRGKSPGEAFQLGIVCGLIHYLGALYWIAYVVGHYGGLPLIPAGAILFLLCAYLALYPAVFAVLAARWCRRPLSWLVGLPAAWVALEFLRTFAVTGFPWAVLGYSQTQSLTLMQSADLWGVYGMSWLLVFANACITAPGSGRQRLVGWLCLALCLGLTAGYGRQRLEQIRALEAKAEPWPVAVVQGNIEQASKWDPEYLSATIERYRGLSEQAVAGDPRPRLLVWPETSMPFFYGLDPEPSAGLEQIIQSLGVPVLFGGPSATLVEGRLRPLNRAFLVDAAGRGGGNYAKRHLVPFGEYVPLAKLLFFVQRLVPAAGDFVPGTSSRPLILNGERVGVLICYEAVFPALARSSVEAGANVLVNLTNDAWFGDSSAPHQHLQMSRWRAVENRVPLVRAANTGISALIEPTGELVATLPLGMADRLNGTVHRIGVNSFYARHGDLFAWICCLTAAVFVLFSAARQRSRGN